LSDRQSKAEPYDFGRGKFPGSEFFDFVGDAGRVVVGVRDDKIREGVLRCHVAALKAAGDDIEVSFAGLLFICSADKLTTTIHVQLLFH
jgi:hypothetical protein